MSKYIDLSGEQELDHNSSPLCKGCHISKQPEFQSSLPKHCLKTIEVFTAYFVCGENLTCCY